ncbi:hypothetical protein [Sphingomonas sp.]|uniref:hypothetical protein n=1 Tax=Sphingomonas sp. TaxID=28214 RepID=UPI0035BBB4F6
MNTLSANLPDDPKQDSGTYQVDLTAMRWCVDSCANVAKVQKADETLITFSGGDNGHFFQVNRLTGVYVSVFLADGFAMTSKGTCKPGNYTGIPERQF